MKCLSNKGIYISKTLNTYVKRNDHPSSVHLNEKFNDKQHNFRDENKIKWAAQRNFL
jgi:hypothetical protein